MDVQGRIFLNNSLRFVRVLRRAGMPVGLDQAQEFAEALTLVDLGSREQVYYAARGLLVRNHAYLRLFDALFNRFWRAPSADARRMPRTMPRAPRHRPQAERFTIATYMAARAGANDPERDVLDKANTASAAERLQRKEFGAMSDEELAEIKALIQRFDWQIDQRLTRRRRPHRRGEQLDMRAVLRDAARHMGTPLRPQWRRRITRPRPLILIADISGSMERYARLLLQFLYSISRRVARVECFVFGTRLTSITRQLRIRNIDRAIDEASREVVDWAGGTQIGTCLHTFHQRWARRVLGRGAVVILISDGWDRGEPQQLERNIRLLRQRSYRLIWLNPLLGQATYQPDVAGMRAALPYIDDFLPIHNLQSLSALAKRIADLPPRRSQTR
jgi:uncharacterized protein with von Willebrand factor type A (vWA) domain